MQIDIPKLIKQLESSSTRKTFAKTAKGLQERLNDNEEIQILAEQTIPNSWQDNYGKTHFYHPIKEMVLIQSREIWDQRLHALRKK